MEAVRGAERIVEYLDLLVPLINAAAPWMRPLERSKCLQGGWLESHAVIKNFQNRRWIGIVLAHGDDRHHVSVIYETRSR
jgi:hypothetical protein